MAARRITFATTGTTTLVALAWLAWLAAGPAGATARPVEERASVASPIPTPPIPLPPFPSPAGPHQLTLTGSASASAGVTFASDVRIRLADLAATLSGNYAGYLFQGDGMLAGAVRVPSLDSSTAGGHDVVAITPTGASTVTVPAGTYRVHLLTDGPATVTVPVEGLAANVAVAPTDPTSVTANVLDLGASTSVIRRLAVTNDGSTLAVVAVRHYATTGILRVAACGVLTSTAECPAGEFQTAILNVASSIGGTWTGTPDTLPSGTSYGVLQIADPAAVGAQGAGLFLTVDLGS